MEYLTAFATVIEHDFLGQYSGALGHLSHMDTYLVLTNYVWTISLSLLIGIITKGDLLLQTTNVVHCCLMVGHIHGNTAMLLQYGISS